MRYLLALLCAVGIVTAQDTPLAPMKRLVTSGNNSVTLGQVVAGYSNNNHIGIRPPFRGPLSSINEEVEALRLSVYPNPTQTGIVNLKTENIASIQVCDMLGNVVHDFNNTTNVNSIITFQVFTRGVYFVKMISSKGITNSSILIFQ